MSFEAEPTNEDIDYSIDSRPLPEATRKSVVLSDRIAATNRQKQFNRSRHNRRPKPTSRDGSKKM